MATAIQRRRGNTAQHASFTGLSGEITIDTTKNTVVVHDGVTAGGYALARADEVAALGGADITAVIAGDGLIGGATSGNATINIGAGAGITVNTDNIALTSGIVTPGTYGTASGIPVLTVDTYGRVTTVSNTAISITASQVSNFTTAANTAIDARIVGGNGLTYTTGTLAVGAGNGITVNADTVELASTTGGAGLTYTSGVLAVGAGSGITVNADNIALTSGIVTAGTYGSATQVAQITVDTFGRTTGVSNVTVTPAVGSITGLGTGVATFLATPSSTNLLAAVTDETGTGALVFANTPTLVTPNIGAATGTSLTTTGNISVGANLTVTGNLIINGTSTTVNSTTVTIDDPIFTLGGDTAPASDDNKDRGIEFRWHNGTSARLGFFGFDDSTGHFTFIPDATNTSDVFSGTTGTLDVASITGSAARWTTARTITLGGDLSGSVSLDGSANVTLSATIAADSVALGTDTTGNYVASMTAGNGITVGTATGEGSTPVITNTGVLSVNTLTGNVTGIATTAGNLSQFAATTSAQLAGVISDETGSGALVFANSPTLVTPALGTPSSGTLTSCTGLPVSTGISGLGTGVATALAVNVGSAGAFVTFNGALGTPSSGTLTNATGLPIGTGVSGLGTGVATFLATPSSANLLAAVTDETGTGALVFANTPTLVTPNIGAATGTSLTTTGGGVLARAAATQDGVEIRGRAGGTGNWEVVITPTTLTADRTLTLADGNTTLQAGTMAVTGGNLGQFAATTSAQLAGVISDETGSGALVFANSPTLVTPALGTPSSGTLTSCTGLPISTGVSGLGTGVATALAVNVGSAGAFVTFNGALGTPSSGTLTSCTGLPISTGVSGLGTGVATFLATPSSANLLAAVTDETGTGALVFANSPTLVTPALGTPSSGTLTSCTGLPISTGVSGLGTGVATFLATPSSANLLAAVTDETGTGALVFANTPTLVTPNIGAATGTSLTTTGGGVLARAAATQDGVEIRGRAGGTGNWEVVITPTTLTADRTVTLADGNTVLQAGTMAITGGNLGQFAATTSSQLAGIISDETGSGALVFGTSPTFTTDITTPAILKSGTNGTGDIGQTANRYGTVWANTFSGLATTARYADLAEKYSADAEYEPGTVLHFGGDAEVTLCDTDMCRKVAGVVTTAPAHLMNAELEGTAAAIALQGRVPCKVVGPIAKGDMMVSAGNGRARAEDNPTMGSVIGKSLENFDGAEGIIEVAVGRL